MILQFKEEQYGWGDSFFIVDENNQNRYRCESSRILWMQKFVIRDMSKNVLVRLETNPRACLRESTIYS